MRSTTRCLSGMLFLSYVYCLESKLSQGRDFVLLTTDAPIVAWHIVGAQSMLAKPSFKTPSNSSPTRLQWSPISATGKLGPCTVSEVMAEPRVLVGRPCIEL